MTCKDCNNYVADNWQYNNRLSELYKELQLMNQDFKNNPNNDYLKDEITLQNKIIDDFINEHGYKDRKETSFCSQLYNDQQYYDQWENDFYIDCDISDFAS
jgi:uncharacterized protein VirK/YbjX